ncbi:unnamed protein product [Caenorhabditis bovis]|uniref:Uncharacterized protein n=1 Tax=Caenorhabditis bovis TaxID=2654633 RepID=A0A8S1EX21_9PELO|nr:unnamed protein product [Caenorhabditis bovis]
MDTPLYEIILKLIWYEAAFVVYVILFASRIKEEKAMLTYPLTVTFVVVLFAHNFLVILRVLTVLGAAVNDDDDVKFAFLYATVLATVIGEAYNRFLDAPLIPVCLLLTSVQRLIIILAPIEYHKLVSGNLLKLYILMFTCLGVSFVLQTFLNCPNAFLMILHTCSTKMTLTNSRQCSNQDRISELLMIQIRIYMLSHYALPFLAIILYVHLALKIGKLDLRADNKLRVSINIILQTTPVILVAMIRAVLAVFMLVTYAGDVDDFEASLAGGELCRYDTYLVFIPLGYIFGNVERWKRIQTIIRHRVSRVSNSETNLDNNVYTRHAE